MQCTVHCTKYISGTDESNKQKQVTRTDLLEVNDSPSGEIMYLSSDIILLNTVYSKFYSYCTLVCTLCWPMYCKSHCTLICALCCTHYCTISLYLGAKKIADMTSILPKANPPAPISIVSKKIICTVHWIMYCRLYFTFYCTLYKYISFTERLSITSNRSVLVACFYLVLLSV